MSETRPELENLRVQDVYPYIQNTPGESLRSVLYTIDNMLKESSPDAVAPGILNWANKDLFVNKWLNASGNAAVTYNPFGESKIAKGRYQITGNGRVYYDRFLAVSEIRGVTGRIFAGATQAGATLTVGVQCYDDDKNLLGDNGGFICDNVALPILSWDFYKSSAFSESATGIRRLKPGTRFVKLFLEVSGNTNLVYFDESELTVFEVDERYLEIFTNVIDWNLAELYHREVSANTTFSFENAIDGKIKTIAVKNVGAGNIEVQFPAYVKWQGASSPVPMMLITPGSTAVFTFIVMGGTYYGSVIEEIN